MDIKPQAEQLISDDLNKLTYKYFDKDSKPIFKTKEINKAKQSIIIYPYYVNKRTDIISQPKIKEIEFLGWSELADLPEEFRRGKVGTLNYNIGSYSFKQLFSVLRIKNPGIEKITIGKNVRTRFYTKSISFNWGELNEVLKQIKKEKSYFDKNRRLLINNELSQINSKFKRVTRAIYYGELKFFLDKFDSFERVTDQDIESISHLFELLPKSKISVTSNFIQTKDRINIVFLEDIITEFEKLMLVQNDNEKSWQTFFEKNSWIFSHLFPFEVILKQKEAYVGGKTIENKDGKVVDFLYENGFQDNFALIEIKTHNKVLLKSTPYRGTDVFSMSDDLSGGINQCLDQKDNFIKEYARDLKPIDPKCILVVGQKKALSNSQLKCFELLRHNQKNVDIVTFDELLFKIKGLLRVLKH